MSQPNPFHLQPLRVALALLLLARAHGQGVLISEIMYHPAGTNVLDEWLELHNTTTNSVDLSGWRLTEGVELAFPSGTRLAPDAFLVIAANAAAFRSLHPGVSNFLAGWSGVLGHDGEEIRLEDSRGRVVDSVTYAPSGDWASRRLGPLDRFGRQGWEWLAEHDGSGKSLELVQERLPNDLGPNWASSTTLGGTPGAPNSSSITNIAPLLFRPAHAPPLPKSVDSVTITIRVADEAMQQTRASLHWRVDGAAAFTSSPLVDDGAHGDGQAGDGLLGAIVPPHPSGTVVEFYFTASDAEGLSRTYPAVDLSNAGLRTANLAYQVDDTSQTSDQPIIRLVMTAAELEYLTNRIWTSAPRSDASVNGTFIASESARDPTAVTQVRYLCDFRNRGHGSRFSVPHNVLVRFAADNPWQGRASLNLNTQYPHSQQFGSALFRKAGIPVPESRPVQVRINGAQLAKPIHEQFGSYAANDPVDDRFVHRQFPLDREGNLYRGVRDMIPGVPGVADLAWRGPDPSSYTNAYSKENHRFANDWSDFITLLDVLNNTPDPIYARTMREVVDVGQWMRYFAANTLLDNQENSLGIGAPDDFALYRGTKDTRFLLLPYDLDSLLARGTKMLSSGADLWRMTSVAAVRRFVRHPEFAPVYFQQLNDLATHAFAPDELHPLFDRLLSGYVDAVALANLKSYQSNHLAHVLALFPHELTATHDLPPVGGYPRSTVPTFLLRGTADPARTREVRVQGRPASWSAWQGTWAVTNATLVPGLNRIDVEAIGFDTLTIARTNLLVHFDHGTARRVSSAILSDTTWRAADGPFLLESTVTVAPEATLTVEPGTSLFLGPGADLNIADGGRLVAEGSASSRIRFSSPPGSESAWGGLILRGSSDSPESRIAYADFEGNGTTCIHSIGGSLALHHVTFHTTSRPYLSLDRSSFTIGHCHFPAASEPFELVHGTDGVKPGGRGLFHHCYFGSSRGYNDVVDFTGGNRPDQSLLRFHHNVFVGSTDDILDLDGTDAWIEDNIFLRVHRNGSPDSASAVSGGHYGSATSEITLIDNLFFDCDNAVTAKEGNFYVMLHNTIVRTTRTGGEDFGSGVVNLGDTVPERTSLGRGVYLEANIVFEAESLVRNDDPARTTVSFVDNILPVAWNGPGSGNVVADPLLEFVPTSDRADFETHEEAQIVRQWFRPRPGSPAWRTPTYRRRLGFADATALSLTLAPPPITASPDAIFSVEPARSGSGIPAEIYPSGAGFTRFRWRLDGGPWSEPSPTTFPIRLGNLVDGRHTFEISGRDDAGTWQDAPELAEARSEPAVHVWTIDRSTATNTPAPTVRINEVLAASAPGSAGGLAGSDWIELLNFGPAPVDLADMYLSDDPGNPRRFRLPAWIRLEPGAFLLLRAGAATNGNDLATGFALRREGEQVLLHDADARGGRLLDSVSFGPQLPGRTIGRRSDGSWGLCRPTPEAPNIALATGNPNRTRINEWLADSGGDRGEDFLELHNPETLPVDLSGFHLSDAAGSLALARLRELTFVDARGYLAFVADGNTDAGPDHLPFRLAAESGLVALSTPDGKPIDSVPYGTQRPGIAEGRLPDGSGLLAALSSPSPGRSNTPETDSDRDGIDDAWERLHFGNLSRDGTGDFDSDGLPDRGEFLAGTHPGDPSDALRFTSIDAGHPVRLAFVAKAGKAYRIEHRESLEPTTPWQVLQSIPPRVVAGNHLVEDPAPAPAALDSGRFYRLVVVSGGN